MTINTHTIPKVRVISLSEEDRHQGKYTPISLGKVLEAMHQDGLVVLKGVIDVNHIEKLNKKMCIDADIKRKDPSQVYNHLVKCKCINIYIYIWNGSM